MNLNEWLGFIDEIASKHNFDKMDEIFDQADDDKSVAESDNLHTQKSVSFVGEMVKQVNRKVVGLRRQSTLLAKGVESG